MPPIRRNTPRGREGRPKRIVPPPSHRVQPMISNALLVHNNLMSNILPYVENVTDLIHLYQTSPEVQQILGKGSEESFAGLLSLMQRKSTPFKSDLQINGFIGTVDLTVTDISNLLTKYRDNIPIDAVRIEMNRGNWMTLYDLVEEIQTEFEHVDQYRLNEIMLIGFNQVKLVVLCQVFRRIPTSGYTSIEQVSPSYFATEIDRGRYKVFDHNQFGMESNLGQLISERKTEIKPPSVRKTEILERLQREKAPLLDSLDIGLFKDRLDVTCDILAAFREYYQDQNMEWAMGFRC